MGTVTAIPTYRMNMHMASKELTESICHADCQGAKPGDAIENPYMPGEPEYGFYRKYAYHVFGVTAR